MLFALLFVLLCVPISTASKSVDIQHVKKTGVIFENIGQAITYRQHWTLLTQLNIPQWDNAVEFIQQCEKTLTELCNSINHTSTTTNCNHWSKEIKAKMIRSKEKIGEVNIYTKCPTLRTKRGLIDVGGAISKFVFGTMDHEDSEKIYAKLEELEKSTDKTIDLAKQQVTLLKSNNEILGDSLLNLTNQHNLLVEKSNRVNSLITVKLNNFREEVKTVQIMAEMNEIALFMLNELQKINEQLTTTLFILESIQRQELNPLMLPTEEFKNFYSKITADNQNSKFDFSLTKSITRVYSTCLDNRILIKILIPILESPYFTVNKVYLAPIPLTDGTYSLLDNIPDYYFSSTFSHKDFELTESKFKTNCIAANTTLYLCKLLEPIRITPGSKNCVQNLFEATQFNPPNCQHRVMVNFNSFLIPMYHENSWLYWMHDPMPLYCQCAHELQTIQLQDLGILRLLQPCIYSLSEFVIPFKSYALHNLSIHQPDKIDNPEMQKYKKILNLPSIKEDKKLNILDSTALRTNLKKNSKTIDHLEADLANFETERSNKILRIKVDSFYGVSGMVLVIMFVVFLIKRLKRSKQQQEASKEEIRRIKENYISRPIRIPRREEILTIKPDNSSDHVVQIESQPTTP